LTVISVSTREYVLVRANLKVSVRCMYASDTLYLNDNSRLVFIIILHSSMRQMETIQVKL